MKKYRIDEQPPGEFRVWKRAWEWFIPYWTLVATFNSREEAERYVKDAQTASRS